MRLAFAIAAVVAYFLALHALNHPRGWARAARALWQALRRFWAYLVTEPSREPVTPQDIAAHPAVKAAMSGPLPADGEPLKDWEAEALAALWWSVRNESAPQPRDGSQH